MFNVAMLFSRRYTLQRIQFVSHFKTVLIPSGAWTGFLTQLRHEIANAPNLCRGQP